MDTNNWQNLFTYYLTDGRIRSLKEIVGEADERIKWKYNEWERIEEGIRKRRIAPDLSSYLFWGSWIEGKYHSEIAEELGVNVRNLNHWSRRFRIPPKPLAIRRKSNRPSRQTLAELYKSKNALEIASELGVCNSTIGNWLRRYRIPLKPISECKKGRLTDDGREKLRASKTRDWRAKISVAKTGKHVTGHSHTEETRRKLSQKALEPDRVLANRQSGLELAKRNTYSNYTLNERLYDSKSEAACAELLEKYIPGFRLQEGATFQANGDTSCLFDFILPNAIVEWHPIRVRYDAPSREDWLVYKELMGQTWDANARREFRRYYEDDLAVDYWISRQEASENSQVYQGKEVILARDFRELYNLVLKRFGENIPSERELKKEFEGLKSRAIKTIKKQKSEAA